MSHRWAALIGLPPERQQALTAILAAMEVRVLSIGWEKPAGQDQAQKPPPVSPALIVAPADEYGRKNSRLTWLDRAADQAPVVLLAPAALSPDILRLQVRHDVLNVIPDALWGDTACLERTFRGFLFPEEMFELSRFVPDATLVQRMAIGTLADKRRVGDEVADLVGSLASARQARDLRLVLAEMINNAFFHSFLDTEGRKKYSARHFTQLDDGDRVVLEVAIGKTTAAVAVEDNSGTLRPQDVLKYLLRQASGEGVYDSHGRGFYLISNLVDHLSICLAPGKRAWSVAMNHLGDAPLIQTVSFFISR